jgi:hypothetical protein
MADMGGGFIAPAWNQIAAALCVLVLTVLTLVSLRWDSRLSFVAAYFFTPLGFVFVAGLVTPVWVERTLLFVVPAFWVLVGGLTTIWTTKLLVAQTATSRSAGFRWSALARRLAVSAAVSLCLVEAFALFAQITDRYAAYRRLPSLTAYTFVAAHSSSERFLNVENFTATPFEVLDAMNHRATSQWELSVEHNPGRDAIRNSRLFNRFGSFLIKLDQGLGWDPGSRRLTYAQLSGWCNQGPGFWVVYLEYPDFTVQSPLARLDARLSARPPAPRPSSGIEELIPADFHEDQRVDIDGTIFVHYQKSL